MSLDFEPGSDKKLMTGPASCSNFKQDFDHHTNNFLRGFAEPQAHIGLRELADDRPKELKRSSRRAFVLCSAGVTLILVASILALVFIILTVKNKHNLVGVRNRPTSMLVGADFFIQPSSGYAAIASDSVAAASTISGSSTSLIAPVISALVSTQIVTTTLSTTLTASISASSLSTMVASTRSSWPASTATISTELDMVSTSSSISVPSVTEAHTIISNSEKVPTPMTSQVATSSAFMLSGSTVDLTSHGRKPWLGFCGAAGMGCAF